VDSRNPQFFRVTGIADNSTWSEGDWNNDREFDSGDLVEALAYGDYRQGPGASMAVPEPNSLSSLLLGLFAVASVSGPHRKPFLIFVGEPFSEAELLGYAFDFEQATLHRTSPALRVLGDFNVNGLFDVDDIDMLGVEVASRASNVIIGNL
jgi:hypothetical protein